MTSITSLARAARR